MASFNRVILVGNITRDIDLKYLQSGTAVTEIGLAVNDRRKNQQGEWIDETTFVDINLGGRQAEIAGQYMKKGRPIYVEGRLQMDTWQDKQTGQNRTRLKVVGDNFQFLGGRDDGGGGGGGGQQGGYSAPPAQANQQQPAYQGDPGGGGGGGYEAAGPPPQQSAPPSQGGGAEFTEEDDDIPF